MKGCSTMSMRMATAMEPVIWVNCFVFPTVIDHGIIAVSLYNHVSVSSPFRSVIFGLNNIRHPLKAFLKYTDFHPALLLAYVGPAVGYLILRFCVNVILISRTAGWQKRRKWHTWDEIFGSFVIPIGLLYAYGSVCSTSFLPNIWKFQLVWLACRGKDSLV